MAAAQPPAPIDVRALLAQLNLSDPHCNEGALGFESLACVSPPITFRSHLSSSCPSSEDSISPESSFETDNMLSVDGATLFSEAAGYAPQPFGDGPGVPKAPLAGATATPPSHDGSRYKTELCPEWQLSETCRLGDRCEYAHGARELRSPSQNEAAATFLEHLVSRLAKGKANPAVRRTAKGSPARAMSPISSPATPTARRGQSPILMPVMANAPPPFAGRVDPTNLPVSVGVRAVPALHALPFTLQDALLAVQTPHTPPMRPHAGPGQVDPPAAWAASPPSPQRAALPWMQPPPSVLEAGKPGSPVIQALSLFHGH